MMKQINKVGNYIWKYKNIIDENEKDDFEEKYENKMYPGETKTERFKRKTKEFFEDLKERAINNFEHIKARFSSNKQNEDDIKIEKID